jgi:hypothetical protein
MFMQVFGYLKQRTISAILEVFRKSARPARHRAGFFASPQTQKNAGLPREGGAGGFALKCAAGCGGLGHSGFASSIKELLRLAVQHLMSPSISMLMVIPSIVT